MKKLLLLILVALPLGVNGQRLLNPFLSDTYLAAISTPLKVYVPVGTSFGSINWADYNRDHVYGVTNRGEYVDIPVTWQVGSYSSGSAASFSISGIMSLPSGLSNTLGLVPSIAVDVVALETEFQTVLTAAGVAGYTVPTPINQGDINQLIKEWKALSTYSGMDVLYIMMTDGDANFAKYNYKNPAANNLVVNGTVTYVSREGFQGDGTTGYLATGYNPSTSSNFTLNSAGSGIHVNREATTGYVYGTIASGGRTGKVFSGRSTFDMMNSGGVSSYFDSYPLGTFHEYRTSSSVLNVYQNGVGRQVHSQSTVARPNANQVLLARNNAGVIDNFCNGLISMFWSGGPMDTNPPNFYQPWLKYLRAARVRNTYTSVALGTRLNDSFARASLGTDYTVAAGTWAPDGSKLVVSGGANDFLKKMSFRYGQSAEQVTQTLSFTLASVPAANYGHGTGWRDQAGSNGERSIIAKIDLSNGVNAGKCTIHTWNGTTAAQVAISSTAIPTIANGNSFVMTVVKSIQGGLVDYTVTVTRGSDSVTCTYQNVTGDSTGDFAQYTFGGTINVTNWNINIGDMKGKRALVVGNSVSHGVAATDINDAFSRRLASDYVLSAGSGDLTIDVVGDVTNDLMSGKERHLMELNARFLVSIIGGNDVAAGVSAGTRQARILYTINCALMNGMDIVLVVPPARDGSDMTLIGSYYTGSLPQFPTVDATFTSVKESATTGLDTPYDSGDGVHMNTLGHVTSGNAGRAQMPFLFPYR